VPIVIIVIDVVGDVKDKNGKDVKRNLECGLHASDAYLTLNDARQARALML